MLDNSNPKEDNLSFKVDAGLIDRLGRELVGRAETAVSELIKNAYDADATKVNVKYINSNLIGGTLIIEDNGHGMTLDQLKKGFMTISSTDKIHNPRSLKFHRSKAGRKGIGRFATQRLGHKLTIITQTIHGNEAIKISIDWDAYKIDSQLTDIQNKVEYIPKSNIEGTTLIIDNLRDSWSEADIKRVYRYISDLLQPDYLSEKSQALGFAKQSEESFKVTFKQILDNQEKTIADTKSFLFDKALAVIEGYVDKSLDGYCMIKSDSLDVDNDIMLIPRTQDDPKYHNLSEVHFKAYYFIYHRDQYYSNISKMELKSIQNISNEQGGIRLYRNGFRVLPYGEPNDDWLNIDRRYYNESGTNAPFGNKNLFGFVEIIDPQGDLFEETASREGLIENESFKELTDFLHKAFEVSRNKIRYAVEKKKNETNKIENIAKGISDERTTLEKLIDLEKNVEELTNFSNSGKEAVDIIKKDTQKIFDGLKDDFLKLLDELGMIRVLAGLGLTIGEFTHEVVQFTPSIMGDLSVLSVQNLNSAGVNSLDNLKRTIQLFISYTSYFNSTVSENVSRELRVQSLDSVVANFQKVIKSDLKNLNIDFNVEEYGFDLNTVPMHTSEWTSILFNLYTNSKKAIRRQKVNGKIKVVVGKEDNRVYLEFSDNGDGVPYENRHRVFMPFFTTSSPVGFDASDDEKITGTGLGLKIVKDIILGYGGTIDLIDPEEGFSTCFRIDLPIATAKQIEKYGI
ncbi:ATP-binding protein [Sphingobacterium sp. N143]|uniref:ATP-binding protein n=1 Tax=Sphingobacterium sp. N143 TaxID=2746727 RepID=UPI0025755F3A|nr:ATP-binding protein [Sphingobacterium sp. N143]MDM1296531.1 ATP-binding protein [Sphingobacterium sp. N143]